MYKHMSSCYSPKKWLLETQGVQALSSNAAAPETSLHEYSPVWKLLLTFSHCYRAQWVRTVLKQLLVASDPPTSTAEHQSHVAILASTAGFRCVLCLSFVLPSKKQHCCCPRPFFPRGYGCPRQTGERLFLCPAWVDSKPVGRSCLTDLISFIDKITHPVGQGKPVDVTFFCFSKTFDTASHDVLWNQMSSIWLDKNIRQWVNSWLMGWAQRVIVNRVPSGCSPRLLFRFSSLKYFHKWLGYMTRRCFEQVCWW